MCAEGASLPFRGADAEMERPGDHYTFGPIVSDVRPRKRRNESTPTCQHTGKGPCERMDRNPRHWTVKEQKRKEEEKEQEGKKHRTKETKNNVPLGRPNAAKISATGGGGEVQFGYFSFLTIVKLTSLHVRRS